ncbi:Crp/Fnr family transcriptional regulator [Aestuariibius sp. 2305UL40-4]|uniref:Crp/Fnr family transcriptional regulator n=1 Tax=Aestuariibius violaceus TaxID=3234132 RepID=UPI00345EE7D3
MSDVTKSCLVQKLSTYISLDSVSQRHLARLEEKEQMLDKAEIVNTIGTTTDALYVVKTGWLYAYADLADGRRQILRLYHPGDVIGFPDIAFHHATATVRAVEATCLCPFPKTHLDSIFRESPRLTALLFTLAVRDQVIFMDLMKAMGRMSARERIGYLLLDLISRLRITNTTMTDTFRLPLSQTEIGDMLGLTNVYVSKTFRQLEQDEYLERDGIKVRLLREGDLIEMTDFYNRYVDMDVSWFPGQAG